MLRIHTLAPKGNARQTPVERPLFPGASSVDPSLILKNEVERIRREKLVKYEVDPNPIQIIAANGTVTYLESQEEPTQLLPLAELPAMAPTRPSTSVVPR